MDWQTLPSRARWLFHAQALMRLALFWAPSAVVIAVVVSSVLSLPLGLALAGAWLALQTLIALIVPSLAWARFSWTLREVDLIVAEGVLVRSVSAIPRTRVQHVDVRQGPVERSFGLARLYVYTASGMGADAVLPGLDLAVAEALRDELVRVHGDSGV